MKLQAGAHQSDGTGGAAASHRALAAPSIPGHHCKHDCWVDTASLGPAHWEAMPFYEPGEAEPIPYPNVAYELGEVRHWHWHWPTLY